MATVGSLVVRIGADVSGLDKALQTAQGKLRAVGSQMKQLGTGLTLGVSAPLGAIAVGALSSAADFESAMNMMQAVSGATATQMSDLSAQALEMGRVTSFSAGEAAQAQLELAKSGMTATQVMGALPGVLDLAAAGGLDLANAAEIASNTLNAFGLPATAAAGVANTLAAAANASSIEVTDLADGMKMAGSVFASNGQSVETLATAMALLGNNAIKGSDAGTSLKTMLMRLAAPTAEGAAAMSQLGINVYDAQGKMVPFANIIGSLQTATAGLSDEQRNAALATIFGADAIRSASILIGEGTDGWNSMAAAVGTEGAAATLANARMKGLGGAIEYFKGTIDSLMVESASPFLDTLNAGVRGAADLIAQVTQLPAPMQQFGAVLLAVAAAAGPVLIMLGTMTTAMAGLLSPIGLVAGAAILLGVAFATNFGGIRDITMQMWTAVQPTLAQMYEWLQSSIPVALATMQAAFAPAAAAAQQMFATMMAAAVPIQWVAEAMADAGVNSIEATEAISALPPILQPLATTFQNVYAAVTSAATTLGTLLEPAITRVTTAFAGLPGSLAPALPALQGLMGAVQTLWVALQPILAGIGQGFATIFAVQSVVAVNFLAATMTNFGTIVTAVINQVTMTIDNIATVLQAATLLVQAIIAGDWTTVWASAQTIAITVAAQIVGTWGNLMTIVGGIVNTLKETVVNTLTDMGVDVDGILQGIKTWWDSTWNSFGDAIQPVLDAIAGLKKGIEDFQSWVSGISIPNPFEAIAGGLGGAAAAVQGALGFGQPGHNALGTPNWPGGYTWINERGPEMVWLPSGSVIAPASETASGQGGVVIQQVTINTPMDLEELRWRLADLTRRRG